jgi:hypothetical protein
MPVASLRGSAEGLAHSLVVAAAGRAMQPAAAENPLSSSEADEVPEDHNEEKGDDRREAVPSLLPCDALPGQRPEDGCPWVCGSLRSVAVLAVLVAAIIALAAVGAKQSVPAEPDKYTRMVSREEDRAAEGPVGTHAVHTGAWVGLTGCVILFAGGLIAQLVGSKDGESEPEPAWDDHETETGVAEGAGAAVDDMVAASTTTPVASIATLNDQDRVTVPASPPQQQQQQPSAAAGAQTTPTAPSLPAGWEYIESQTYSGRFFYYHRETNSSSWVAPTGDATTPAGGNEQPEAAERQPVTPEASRAGAPANADDDGSGHEDGEIAPEFLGRGSTYHPQHRIAVEKTWTPLGDAE